MNRAPPFSDQIELTLFGPGYGECAVAHLGANRWLVVDSCLDSATGRPAALAYFEALGVDPAEAIRLITVSHWHDDHIRGMAEVVSSSPSAALCCAAPLTGEEFLARVLDYSRAAALRCTSGVNEIVDVFRQLRSRPGANRTPRHAIANRAVLALPEADDADGSVVTALSPCDREYERFLEMLAGMVPGVLESKRRVAAPQRNDLSIALWVKAGPVQLLLGSDLEECDDRASGWSAIVASDERPQGLASVFKIPHHGSETGHHNGVWEAMVANAPVAVLSPFQRGSVRLPTPRDVTRILELAPESYITARDPTGSSRKRRSAAVERTIRETVGKLRAAQPRTGWVRIRNGGRTNPGAWTVELGANASALRALL